MAHFKPYMESLLLFNHTSWVAIVTPTDRPKSTSNRCVIEVLVAFFVVVVVLLFGFVCGCRGFCHRTGSDIFHFLLQRFSATAGMSLIPRGIN